MATTYRLPEALGGGVCTLVGEPRAEGLYGRVQVGEGEDAFTIDLLRSLLTEVKPPLPEEPRNFSTVRIGSRAYVRDDLSDHLNWYGPDGRKTWTEVVEISMESTGFPPVLLVPDPFAEPVDLTVAGVSVDAHCGEVRLGQAGYKPGRARVIGRALIAAADAAEKEQS